MPTGGEEQPRTEIKQDDVRHDGEKPGSKLKTKEALVRVSVAPRT